MRGEPTHVTAEQFVLMHEYCITPADIAREISRSENGHTPSDLKAVCEHPSHGHCGHREPTEEQLTEINARLNPTQEVKKPGFSYFCLKCEIWHLDDQEDNLYIKHIDHKRGRGRPKV